MKSGSERSMPSWPKGANALAVLKEKGHSLEGIDTAFEVHDSDWNEPSSLSRLLGAIKATGSAVAPSSEGGLFKYGSDDAITANLRILNDGARFVVGSVTSSDEARRRTPRGLEGFWLLAEAARPTIVKAEPAFP